MPLDPPEEIFVVFVFMLCASLITLYTLIPNFVTLVFAAASWSMKTCEISLLYTTCGHLHWFEPEAKSYHYRLSCPINFNWQKELQTVSYITSPLQAISKNYSDQYSSCC